MGLDVPGYLSEQQRKSSSELAPEWAALEELYNKKLWHQLTLRLGEFIKNPALSQGDALVKLYQNFIVDFESRINPLALAEIIVVVCRQITDTSEALPFLEVSDYCTTLTDHFVPVKLMNKSVFFSAAYGVPRHFRPKTLRTNDISALVPKTLWHQC